MPRLKSIVICPFVALLATGFALAVAQDGGNNRPAAARAKVQPPPPIPPDPRRLEELLRLWEKQSKTLNSLEVSIYRIDLSPAWGDEDHYEGHAAFMNPQLAFLDFKKVKLVPDAKKKLVPQVNRNKKRVTTDFETMHPERSLAISIRHPPDLRFSARQECAEASARRRAAPVPLQYEGRRGQGAL
jgi:hypothetical protein